MADKILILGVGNLLFGDDAVGIEAIQGLQCTAPDDVRAAADIVDGGTAGIYLISLLEDRKRVVIVDAVDFRGEPGEILEVSGDDIPRYMGVKLSEHQVNLQEVLSLLDLLGARPADLQLIGIQPAQQQFAAPLSEPVAAALPEVLARVVSRVRRWVTENNEEERYVADECAVCAG